MITTLIRKFLKNHLYTLCAIGIIFLAFSLRLLFISQNWPITDSDESTMGIMAMHIFSHGERPVFFYGQVYMGAFEAYLTAALIPLFGPTLFALRFDLIVLFALFLLSTYFLISLVYNKNLAIVSLILLTFGSDQMLRRESTALGGYVETLLFGSLLFLIAAHLVLSYHSSVSRNWRRLCLYSCWGLIAGLALWCDLIILPFLVTSGLLLLLCCWRELIHWKVLSCMAVCILIGISPLLFYFTAHPQDLQVAIEQIQHASGADTHQRLSYQELLNTVQISIPYITGGTSLCLPINASHPRPFLCSSARTVWGLGYLTLLLCTIILPCLTLARLIRSKSQLPADEKKQLWNHSLIQVLYPFSAVLVLLLFINSHAPAFFPSTASRYLTGVLISFPALLFPLWQGRSSLSLQTWHTRIAFLLKGGLLFCIGCVLLLGTINSISQIPSIQAQNQQEDILIQDLIHAGVTRIYSDYWTCDRIIFASQEKIICATAVADNGHIVAGYDRYPPYYQIVHNAPHAAYAFKTDAPEADTLMHNGLDQRYHYRVFTLDGYLIYQII